jgi:hypothetical protein
MGYEIGLLLVFVELIQAETNVTLYARLFNFSKLLQSAFLGTQALDLVDSCRLALQDWE